MARNEQISLKLDIPENLQSEEEIRRYIAQHLQQYVQQTRLSVGERKQPAERPPHVLGGQVAEPPRPATRRDPNAGPDLEEQLRTARVQLARLYQRYNMVASRLQGSTRRKLLLRSIRRQQARIESLEQQLR